MIDEISVEKINSSAYYSGDAQKDDGLSLTITCKNNKASERISKNTLQMEKLIDQEEQLINAIYHEPLKEDTTLEVVDNFESTRRYPPVSEKNVRIHINRRSVRIGYFTNSNSGK